MACYFIGFIFNRQVPKESGVKPVGKPAVSRFIRIGGDLIKGPLPHNLLLHYKAAHNNWCVALLASCLP